MIAEWNDCNEVFQMGQLLVKKGLFDLKLWRHFHCSCYRNVWNFISNDAQNAIVKAERAVANELSVNELASVHEGMVDASNAAWDRVNSLKEATESSDAIWPVSDEVDDAWCAYLSAECAMIATQSEIDAYSIPESASSLVAWATARKTGVDSTNDANREEIELRWKEIRDDEEKNQASILREIVSHGTPYGSKSRPTN